MSTTDNPSSAIERHPWLAWCTPEQREWALHGTYDGSWANVYRSEFGFIGVSELLAAMQDPELPGLYVPPVAIDPERYLADMRDRYCRNLVPPEGMALADYARFVQLRVALSAAIDEEYRQAAELAQLDDVVLSELNSRYTWVRNMGNKVRIAYWENDPALNRRLLRTVPIETFRANEDNKLVTVEHVNAKGEVVEKYVPRGTWWTKHPLRNEVESVVFKPNAGKVPGHLNLWQGYAVQAMHGDRHVEFLDHLETVICAGNAELYEYVLNWLARMVQRPGEPGGVALVFRSTEEGTGKGFTANMLGRLFGPHYLQVTQPSHLVGNFNAHLRTCVLLFADEAFNPHDKKHEAILKTLVTEPTLTIEGKGIDVDTSANCIHLLLASNEEHVVSASEFARRFCVCEVNPLRAGDKEYFAELAACMENGGLQDLLGFLLARDISAFNVFDVPNTEGLERQKALTMPYSDDTWADEVRHRLKGLLERDMALPVRDAYHLVGMDPVNANRHDQIRLTKVMRALGFEKGATRVDGNVVKAWAKGKGDLPVRAEWQFVEDPDGKVRRTLAVTAGETGL